MALSPNWQEEAVPRHYLLPFLSSSSQFFVTKDDYHSKMCKIWNIPLQQCWIKIPKDLLWHKQHLQKKIIEHTETCVKSAQDKPNHSCACTPPLYKIRLIKWINQGTTGSFPMWHWLVNEHDLAGARGTKKLPQKEDSWKSMDQSFRLLRGSPLEPFQALSSMNGVSGCCTGIWPVPVPNGLDCRAHEYR